MTLNQLIALAKYNDVDFNSEISFVSADGVGIDFQLADVENQLEGKILAVANQLDFSEFGDLDHDFDPTDNPCDCDDDNGCKECNRNW